MPRSTLSRKCGLQRECRVASAQDAILTCTFLRSSSSALEKSYELPDGQVMVFVCFPLFLFLFAKQPNAPRHRAQHGC